MFFRMLKKDLKESPGLNLFIFISMIVCSILIVTGSILLYSSIFGFNNSYKKANSSDVFVVTSQSLTQTEKKHSATQEWFRQRDDIESFYCTQMINLNSGNIKINGEDFSNRIGLASLPVYMLKQPRFTNLVVDEKNQPFEVGDGTIAIPQNLKSFYKINVGDKVQITTQLGNIYEFTVGRIFKDSSIYMYYRFLLSDADYDFISRESPLIFNNYEIKTTNFSDINIAEKIFSDYEKEDELEKIYTHFNCVSFEGSKLMTSIVAILCAGIAIFLIFVVAMTLRFTLSSIIKKEERSLGTLKAIGVDSFSFKWLFTAKFIFFSIISGIIGVIAGIPVTNLLLDSIMLNIISPAPQIETTIGVISACLTVALIILFIFNSLRKINKISIISAIHGESRSERFNKIPGLELAKCKNMKLPLFLALTDILGRFKRYIFLALSYLFGFAIILLVFQLKNTVISWDFLHKVQLMGEYDFYIELPDSEAKKYAAKTDGTFYGIYNKVNEELKENNIPAHIELQTYSDASLIQDGTEYLAGLVTGMTDLNKIYFRKGSVVPEKPNEVAINYLMAKKFNIGMGDTITLKYKKKKENKIDYREVTGDFIVTGFTDVCSNAVLVMMAACVDDVYPLQVSSSQTNTGRIVACEIYAPETEKPYYLEKIRELYGAENVQSGEEFFDSVWRNGNESIFSLLRNLISILILFVMILNTALYEKIFIEEEASDIAMLKTLGISKISIKLWHYFRILILIVAGYILGTLVTLTAGNALMESALHVLMYASGFDLIAKPLVEYVVIPLVLISAISATLFVCLKNINSIFIWRIKDE